MCAGGVQVSLNALDALGLLVDRLHCVDLCVGHVQGNLACTLLCSFLGLALASEDDGRLLQLVVVLADAVHTVAFQHGGDFRFGFLVGHAVCSGEVLDLVERRHHRLVLVKRLDQTFLVHADAASTEEVHDDLGVVFSLAHQHHGVQIAKGITHALGEHLRYLGLHRCKLVSGGLTERGDDAGGLTSTLHALHGLPHHTIGSALTHRELVLQRLDSGARCGVQLCGAGDGVARLLCGGFTLCSGVGLHGERSLGNQLDLLSGQVVDTQRGAEDAVDCRQDAGLDLVVQVAQSADFGQGARSLGHGHLFDEVSQQLVTEDLWAPLHVTDRDALVCGLRHLGFGGAVSLLDHVLQAGDDGVVLLRADQVLHTQVGTDLVQGHRQHFAGWDAVGVQGDGLAVIQATDLAAIG